MVESDKRQTAETATPRTIYEMSDFRNQMKNVNTHYWILLMHRNNFYG